MLMSKPDESKWIKLQLIISDPYDYVKYEDGLGQKASGQFAEGEERHFLDFAPDYQMSLPLAMGAYINDLVNTLPKEHITRDGYQRLPLAVYMDLPKRPYISYDIAFLERHISQYLENVIQDRQEIQLLHYSSKIEDKPPFSLPFNIRYLNEATGNLLEEVRTASWYNNNTELERFGLNMRNMHAESRDISDPDTDILLVNEEEYWQMGLETIETVPPRLLIVICRYPYWFQRLPYRPLGRGVRYNHLFISLRPETVIGKYLKDFIYALIHDFPLHEALYHARQLNAESYNEYLLISSPVANQYLRIRDAIDSFKNTIHNISSSLNLGNINNFIAKLSELNNDIASRISQAIARTPVSSAYLDDMKLMNVVFDHESEGLMPVANARAELDHLQGNFDQLHLDLKNLVNNEQVFNAVRAKQQRKVDITLDEFTHYLLYSPVGPYRSLQWGQQYRLNVTIGQPSSYSLIKSDIASIDPLLPDPENAKGHEIDIVVFPKEFTLLSPSSQTVHLPLLGGTIPASFYVKAPLEGSGATLRVCVFHKNCLLQAFLLEASITESGNSDKMFPITATLDLACSERFTNLDALKPRALYIGVNDNGDSNHTLFIKKDQVAEEISGLNEELIKDAQRDFKKILDAAYKTNGELKYSSTAQPGSAIEDTFYDDVRELVRFGKKYYSKILRANSRELQNKLRDIKKQEDLEITIARHQVNFTFPWALLYDYDLLLPAFGDPEHPVCMGHELDPALYKDAVREDGKGCPHNPGLYTYCIEGFWGVRHRIEQLLKVDKSADARIYIKRSAADNIIVCNNITDDYGETLNKELAKQYPVLKADHETKLFNLLWDKATRPSSLVVLGHLETAEKQGEPAFPRIITFPRKDWPAANGKIPLDKWIYHDLLDSKITSDDPWEDDPLPLILLINCSNAGMNVDSLHSIVRDFQSAGATAVIGTECDISSGLGARFISEVLDSIYKKDMELGAAIQHFNKRLFESGIPLAFVFTCFGNLNVKMVN